MGGFETASIHLQIENNKKNRWGKTGMARRFGIRKLWVGVDEWGWGSSAILERHRLSSVPISAPPVDTASPFKPCIPEAIALPTIDSFIGYTNLNSAFTPFITASGIFSMERIDPLSGSIVFGGEIVCLFHNLCLLPITSNRHDVSPEPV